MFTCEQCVFFAARVPVTSPIATGTCYGLPPVNILVPVPAGPLAPRGAMMPEVKSTRPAVFSNDTACSLIVQIKTDVIPPDMNN